MLQVINGNTEVLGYSVPTEQKNPPDGRPATSLHPFPLQGDKGGENRNALLLPADNRQPKF